MTIRPGSKWESHNRGHPSMVVVVRHATVNYVRAFPLSKKMGGVPDRVFRFKREEFISKFRPVKERKQS